MNDDRGLEEFRSLCRGYQIATFTAVTVSYPFIMLWVMFEQMYEGIASGVRFTWIEWRSMRCGYRKLWNAIDPK